MVFGQNSYLWKPIEDAPKEMGLWKEGKQLGALNTETLEYWKLNNGAFVKADPPTPMPEKVVDDSFKKKCEKGDYGVVWDKIEKEKEVYTFSGEEIDKQEFQNLIGDINPLVDDSSKLHLTIIAEKAKKESAKSKIVDSEVYKEFEKDIHLQVFSTNSWILKEHGFKATGPITYYLQEANGKVIYSGDDPEGLLDKLRILKRPPPTPWSINWSSWSLGFNPFTWMAGLAWSKLSIPLEPIILIVILVLGFFLIRKKGK
jgi:hypothetical protein